MVHQDLRPENIMIDRDGAVKIIDFGSTTVAGVREAAPEFDDDEILDGTVRSTRIFPGPSGNGAVRPLLARGRDLRDADRQAPYGAEVAKARSRKAQGRLRYATARNGSRRIPDWLDDALRRAVHPDPLKRHEAVSEFIADLRRPNPDYLPDRSAP